VGFEHVISQKEVWYAIGHEENLQGPFKIRVAIVKQYAKLTLEALKNSLPIHVNSL